HPALLRELGRRIAERARWAAGLPELLAGPELGGVALAASASLAGELPFLIVRKDAKAYGTERRVEGVFEAGQRVCLVEDVVTTGGAAVAAVRALRDVGLECRAAVCVVDRDEGGTDALARHAVRLHPLFRAVDILAPDRPRRPKNGSVA
ncbi:MAG: hypothetical protein ICV74_11050, partial [Thermoleophilia bacterium]|nr:hypothetical protein [Thermoleophilia bacterium]